MAIDKKVLTPEMEREGQNQLEAIRLMCSSWTVNSGESYVASSKLSLNARPDMDVSSFQDTAHDLHDKVQFVDFMNARSKQAAALISDVDAYMRWSARYPSLNQGRDVDMIRDGFVQRAGMALYGVDLKQHPEMLDAKCEGCDAAWLSDAVSGGKYDNIIRALSDFRQDWAAVRRAEKSASASRESDVPAACVTFPYEPENHVDVQSQEMLNYYVSETCGREAYAARLSDSRMVSMPCIDSKSLDLSVANEIGRRCFDYVRNGVGKNANFLDASELVMCAKESRVISGSVRSADIGIMEARYQNRADCRRNVRDLDAACSEIESSPLAPNAEDNLSL